MFDTPEHARSTALGLARVQKALGGLDIKGPHIPRARHVHVGPIHSAVAGRTDHLNLHVPSGSYVLPADIVSSFGEGNTLAGFKHIKRMFSGAPYGGAGMPYGANSGPYGAEMPGKAAGGVARTGGPPVPIMAAGGEFVLQPHEVLFAGGGNLDAGHKALDEFVNRTRSRLVKTLRKLPKPKVD